MKISARIAAVLVSSLAFAGGLAHAGGTDQGVPPVALGTSGSAATTSFTIRLEGTNRYWERGKNPGTSDLTVVTGPKGDEFSWKGSYPGNKALLIHKATGMCVTAAKDYQGRSGNGSFLLLQPCSEKDPNQQWNRHGAWLRVGPSKPSDPADAPYCATTKTKTSMFVQLRSCKKLNGQFANWVIPG